MIVMSNDDRESGQARPMRFDAWGVTVSPPPIMRHYRRSRPDHQRHTWNLAV